MTPERWRRIEEAFYAALDCPAAERQAFLARLCGDDEELRREVLSLLAQEDADTFIHGPIKNVAASLAAEPKDDMAGRRIGAFRITRLVGHGGMGAVYSAVRDDEQFDQQVAIKIIKRGMDTDFVRERFLRERRILASLQHPHIARLLDGGTTPDGLPYFAMEFVEGEPVTNYCRGRRLSLNNRLKLFLLICSAVQHAHQKLIVHRDLKPSNILVAEDGTPKLLDFGIAKLLARDGGEAAAQTETDMRIMTPDKVLRLLAEGYFKVGALQSEAGDKAAASETLRQAVAAAEDLERQSREIADLSLVQNSYVRLGDTQLDTGDPAAALESYRHSLRVSERRAAERLGEYARLGLAIDHSHVGEALASMGDLGGAIESYRRSLSIVEELLRERPSDLRYIRAHMIAYVWLGHFSGSPRHINEGNEAAALQYYLKALALAEKLAALDEKDANARLDLAASYCDAADILSRGDPAQSVEYYRKALSISRDLLRQSPDDFRFLRAEARYVRGLAGAMLRLGDRQPALQNHRRALDILQALSKKDPANAQVRIDLHAALLATADLALDMGDAVSALEHYRQALSLAESAMATHSSNAYALWRLADSYAGMGRYHAALGSDPKAASEERIARWRAARDWRKKGLDVWDGWAQRAASSAFNTARREEAARALAECDAALARL